MEVGVKISGIIEDVEYDENRKFKGFDGKPDYTAESVRFKFKFDDYGFPHYSRWMKLSLNEKSTLYKKYALALVKEIYPDAHMDIDVLKGMRIKTTWITNGDFQNLETIEPEGEMIDGKFSNVTEDDLEKWSN